MWLTGYGSHCRRLPFDLPSRPSASSCHAAAPATKWTAGLWIVEQHWSFRANDGACPSAGNTAPRYPPRIPRPRRCSHQLATTQRSSLIGGLRGVCGRAYENSTQSEHPCAIMSLVPADGVNPTDDATSAWNPQFYEPPVSEIPSVDGMGVRDLRPMTTTQEEVHGTWWLPTEPDRVAAGTLRLQHGARPRLEVHVPLVDPVTEEHAEESTFTVHGQSGGQHVTLLNAVAIESQVERQVATGKQYIHQVLQADTGALIGREHIDDADHKMFAEAFIEVDYLTFLAKSADPTWSERETQQGATTATFVIPLAAELSAQFGGLKATLTTRETYTGEQAYGIGGTSIPVTYRAIFRLQGDAPMAVQQFSTAARELSDLVTLGMLRPAHVRRIDFDAAPGSANDRYRWWGTDPMPREEILGFETRRNIAFTFLDADLATMLPAWNALLTTARYGVGSTIALLRETSTYHETKLLGVCGALEALCRGLGLQGTYRQRAEALAGIVAPTVRVEVIPSVDKWAEYLTKARNSLAHGDEPEDRKVPEDVWYALEHPTLALLILVLMTKLGVSEKAQRLALNYKGLRTAASLGTRYLT